MKLKKLSLTLLFTLGFCTTLVGGALAADTNTTPTTSFLLTTATDGTSATTTAPTVIVTTPPTVEIKEKAYPGTVKAIDVVGKKITVVSANKKVTTVITLDEKTTYIYKGKAIDPAKIGVGSIVVVTVQITGEKGKEVYKAVKVQVNTLTEKKKPVKKEPVKKQPVKKHVKKVVNKTVKVTKVVKKVTQVKR
jgi:hypothetical protein